MSATPAKAWAHMQARAALMGMQLVRSAGEAGAITLIDSKGLQRRIECANDLEEMLAPLDHQEVA